VEYLDSLLWGKFNSSMHHDTHGPFRIGGGIGAARHDMDEYTHTLIYAAFGLVFLTRKSRPGYMWPRVRR
jgi:hypothetical protein